MDVEYSGVWMMWRGSGGGGGCEGVMIEGVILAGNGGGESVGGREGKRKGRCSSPPKLQYYENHSLLFRKK